MSDRTRADLEAAIAAHIADEDQALTGAWLLATQVLDHDGADNGYRFETEGSVFTTMGLAHAYLTTIRPAEETR